MSTIVESPQAATPPAVITPAALLAMPDGVKYELVNGRLVERNVSNLSSFVALELGSRLRDHARQNNLGHVFGPDMGFRCFSGKPNKVRRPDVSFLIKSQIGADFFEDGYAYVPPSLAVEVVSPNDLAEDLQIKLKEYLSAGVRLVWIIYPISRTARVVGLDGSNADLGPDDHLSGQDVLPGFACRVGDLIPAEAPTAT
jgi:Uma2 family endonuclease